MTSNETLERLPIVRRTKSGLEADIAGGRVCLSNDGGRLEWLGDSGASRRTAELRATLATEAGAVELRQGTDPDPRLVICEQGPVRIVLRAQFDLLDEHSARWGEGLTEWTLYADGAIVGVVSLRLVNAGEGARLKQAGLHLSGVGGSVRQLVLENNALSQQVLPQTLAFSNSIVGMISENQCVAWQTGVSKEYRNGKGAWQGFGEDTPYYEDWGILPGQGWGDSGWDAGPGAGVYSDEKNGAVELAFTHSEAGMDLALVHALQGQCMFLSGEEGTHEARIIQWLNPVQYDAKDTGYRGYSVPDGAHLFYTAGASEWALTVPPSEGPSVLHLYGLSHWGGWEVTCNEVRLVSQLINDGRGCDDPNGLQLGRFDDRHGSIIGCTDVPANRMILLVPPSGDPQTIKYRAVEGLALSYLHWDDRQIYLVQSSANTERNLVELVVRDGKLRHLVAPHSDEVSIAAIPLYWYQCNTPTPYMATDEIQEYILKKAGPDAIEFDVLSRNRFGCAKAVYHVHIPFCAKLTRVDVEAELQVLKTWEFKDLQLLNLFAEEFRDHTRWPHKYALAVDSSGQRMLKHPKQGRQVQEGSYFMDYEPPLVFAHYSADRGNVFLIQTRMDGPVTCQHFLCPHWIDSHYHIVNETGRLEAGDAVSGSYTMIIDDGRKRNTEDIDVLAKAIIAGTDPGEAVM